MPQPVDDVASEPLPDAPERDAILGGEAEPKGVGGFLFLVGIAVFLSPLINILTLLMTYPPLFAGPTWKVLTTVDSPAYHAMWAPLIIGEISMNVLFIVASGWLIFLFQRRSRRFPPAYVGYMVAGLMFVLIDDQLVSLLLKDYSGGANGQRSGAGRALVSAAIWVPYMLRSRRVRNTFVN